MAFKTLGRRSGLMWKEHQGLSGSGEVSQIPPYCRLARPPDTHFRMLLPIIWQFAWSWGYSPFCSPPWQTWVFLERVHRWPHAGHLPGCGSREGAQGVMRCFECHTPRAALGTSLPLTVVSSNGRYTPVASTTMGLPTDFQEMSLGCLLGRGGSTMSQSLPCMVSSS